MPYHYSLTTNNIDEYNGSSLNLFCQHTIEPMSTVHLVRYQGQLPTKIQIKASYRVLKEVLYKQAEYVNPEGRLGGF